MDCQARLMEHYDAHADETFVMIGLQGAQNYNLETDLSDVDTKMVVVPSLADVIHCRKPVSITRVMENDEHCTLRDVRLFIESLRKMNFQLMEILFTKHYYIHPDYAQAWSQLISNREALARYNEYRGINYILGVAREKLNALEHRYPSRAHMIDEYGYDPKQLHHILRAQEFAERYADNKPVITCLTQHWDKDWLKRVKLTGADLTLEEARHLAVVTIKDIEILRDSWVPQEEPDPAVTELYDTVLEDIMTTAFRKELNGHS